MSAQYFGAGSLLAYGGLTSPASYTTVGGIKGVIKGSKKASIKDVSTHDVIATDKTMRKAGGLIDPGQYTFQVFSDLGDTQQAALLANVGSTGYFRVTPAGYSPAKTITFQAVIGEVSDSYPLDDYQVFDITLDVSGPKVVA